MKLICSPLQKKWIILDKKKAAEILSHSFSIYTMEELEPGQFAFSYI